VFVVVLAVDVVEVVVEVVVVSGAGSDSRPTGGVGVDGEDSDLRFPGSCFTNITSHSA